MAETMSVELPSICSRIVKVLNRYRHFWQTMTRFVKVVGSESINLETCLHDPTLARVIIRECLVVRSDVPISQLPLDDIATINQYLDTVPDDDLTIVLIAALTFGQRG